MAADKNGDENARSGEYHGKGSVEIVAPAASEEADSKLRILKPEDYWAKAFIRLIGKPAEVQRNFQGWHLPTHVGQRYQLVVSEVNTNSLGEVEILLQLVEAPDAL